MTLQRRFALLAAIAVAVAVMLASGVVYVVVRGELRGRIDDELRTTATRRLPLVAERAVNLSGAGGFFVQRIGPGGPGLPPPRDALGLATAYISVVDGSGNVVMAPGGSTRLPVTSGTRAVATGARRAFLADASVGATPVRVLTAPIPGVHGYAVQIARPLSDVDRTLNRLAIALLIVSAGGIALAAALGRFVARTALRPVGRLTDTVEAVARTRDLTRRIGAAGGADDEIARLGRSFDAMLAALEDSARRQRQLVADASHELRTPLTSLRTNIEVLARPAGLPDDERDRLLTDVVEQLEELGALVGDVVELAREGEPAAELEDVRLDELVAAAVARARRRAAAPIFAAELEPCIVHGAPARLDRAVGNLLDNAAKWSPAGGEVTVALHGGELTVRDRGPGIASADLPHVFERFYRASSARGMPGSGLGLAIVRQVAELHGGRVEARAADGGGALLRLVLPVDTTEEIVPLVDTTRA
jgi:two-component system, OmpR family, sensor histidine kinase MprB